jgi:hypothetical protein
MMEKENKGAWTKGPRQGRWRATIIDEEAEIVGYAIGRSREEAVANASLIASAPDMAEALGGLVVALKMKPGPRGVMELVPAALAKAEAALSKANPPSKPEGC